jgi:hypothetical protein
MGDNSAAMEEAERVQLISFVSRISQATLAVEAAQAPLDAAKKARTQLFNLAKAALPGMTRKEIETRIAEMNDPSREFAAKAAREHKHRRWLGILDADQAELMLGKQAPQEKKDEAHWAGEGYKAGLRQLEAKPPGECESRFHQTWLQAHERGLIEVTTANAPKPMKPVRDQAAEDFKDDNPEVDLAKAARKLKNDPAFMATDGPDAVSDHVAGEMAAGVIHEPGTNGEPEDEFEATPEELEQQAARRAAREVAAAGEDVV